MGLLLGSNVRRGAPPGNALNAPSNAARATRAAFYAAFTYASTPWFILASIFGVIRLKNSSASSTSRS